MRCENCGKNVNHCPCPMKYEYPKRAEAVEQSEPPQLPQAVTAEPEPVRTERVIDTCKELTGDIPPEPSIDQQQPQAEDFMTLDELRYHVKELRLRFVLDIAEKTKHLSRLDNNSRNYSEVIHHQSQLNSDLGQLLAVRNAALALATADRDGARRALAGNIEVSERQLKEQYTTIERLKRALAKIGSFYASVHPDEPAWFSDELAEECGCDDDDIQSQFPRAEGTDYDAYREMILAKLMRKLIDEALGTTTSPASPNLQPGTEADHGPQQPA